MKQGRPTRQKPFLPTCRKFDKGFKKAVKAPTQIGILLFVLLFASPVLGPEAQDPQSALTGDDVALQKALAAAAPGATVRIEPRIYRLTLPLEVAKPVTITGTAGSELQFGTPKRALLKITSSHVNISNLKLTGPNYTVNHDQERAIEAVGASAFAPLSQITIENCEITSWGGYGVYLKYVHDFTVNGNRISRIDYAAVQGLSVKNGMISNNVISNVIGTHDSYGIALSRESGNLNDQPRSADVKVIGNSIRDVPNWEALDTHGGERIAFINNSVAGCYAGIVIGVSKDAAGHAVFSPLDCVVEGNELDSGRKDGSAGFGIVVRGADIFPAAPVAKATASIRNNVVIGYGDQSDTNHGAIHAFNTDHLIISGNRIIEPSPYGINLLENNSEALIVNNTIIDPWSNRNGQAVGIYLRGANNSASIDKNEIRSVSKRAVSILTSGVRVANGRNRVRMGTNRLSSGVLDDAGQNNPAVSTMMNTSEVPSQPRSKVGFNWNAPQLAERETASVDVKVEAARIGDTVRVIANTSFASCVTLTGTVSLSGIVTLTLTNRCGRSIRAASIRILIEDWEPAMSP